MRKFWASAGVQLGKHATKVAIVVVVVSIALAAFGLPRLEFGTSQDSYLNDDDPIAIDNEQYQSLFGGQAMVSLFTAQDDRTVVDLFTPENVRELAAIEEELRATGRFEAVISPLTALRFTQNLVTPRDPESGELLLDAADEPQFAGPSDVVTSAAGEILLRASAREEDEAAAGARDADSVVTLERLGEALADGATFESPDWVRFLLVDNTGNIRKALRPFFPFPPGVEPTLENATHAQMVVRLQGNLSIVEEGDDSVIVTDAMSARSFEGFDVVTTGAPVLLKDLNDYLSGGMATLGLFAVLMMIVVLWFVFRVRWRLLSLASVLVGSLWAFAMLGVLDLPMAIVTISGLPILIGMGVDLAIQVHNRVEEEVVLDKELHPMAETLTNLAPALITATVAAMVAFLSLQISHVPMLRDFGVLLAMGIALLCVTGIVIPTAVLGWREWRSRTRVAAPESAIERVVPRLGGLPSWTAVPFAVLAVLVLVAGVLLEDRFTIETDPEKWVNQDTQVIDDLHVLREETGSSSELGLFVQSDDVFTDETGAFVHAFANGQLAANPEGLLTASSLTTTVSFLMEIPGATLLPPTGDDLRAAYDVAPPDIQRSMINEDGTAANVIFRTGPSSLEDRRVLVEAMELALAPALASAPGLSATPSGLAVVGIGLLENLEANRAQLTYVALGLIAMWLLVRYRNFGRAVLAMIPVLLAVGVSSLVVALSGITLSPLTTVSGPLVAAAVTEFSVLILARYLEERGRGLSPLDAKSFAAKRSGRAFVASALTTIGGFLVLVFSALPLLRDFGAIVTLNVSVALTVALVVLPPMLVWADEHGLLSIPPYEGPAIPEPDQVGAVQPTPSI